MKKLLFTLLSLGFLTTYAQDAKMPENLPITTPVHIGDTYGEGVSNDAFAVAVSVNELEKMLKESEKLENVVVKGTVTDVCPEKGCWVTLDSDSDQRFFVKMKDYGFFVSTDLKGKKIVLQGDAENKIVSVGELKHYAEDAGKSEKEIAAITTPGKEVRFMASGIRVID